MKVFDEYLLERYEQLKEIHDRLEDLVYIYRTCRNFSELSPRLHNLADDVRKMKEQAKLEYEKF